MSSIIVILGSTVGFTAAAIGWIALDLSFLSAMTIWLASGPAAALIAAVLAMLPQDRRARESSPVMANI